MKYGLFLDFVARSNRLNPNAEAGAHATPKLVAEFVNELQARVGSVTVYSVVHNLRRFTQLLAPVKEIGWLMEMERELFAVMRPKSKWNRVVLAEVTIEAGLRLISNAEATENLGKLTRARFIRNGLMIALLAHYPIRIKNYASLTIGRSLVKIDNVWWIILSASDTKEKKPDERPIEDYLGRAVDKYIGTYRPVLARGRYSGPALWLAETGAPMAQCSVGETITETTRSTLGVPISPHIFRAGSVTTVAIHAGHKPYLGSAILHHRHPIVAQQNYNRASGITASKAYGRLIKRFRAGQF